MSQSTSYSQLNEVEKLVEELKKQKNLVEELKKQKNLEEIKKNKFQSELIYTKIALQMTDPLYWGDYSKESNSTLHDYLDSMTDKMSSFIDLDEYLKEEEDTNLALAKVIGVRGMFSSGMLSDVQVSTFVLHLIEKKNIKALKEFDSDELYEFLEDEFSKEDYDSLDKLLSTEGK